MFLLIQSTLSFPRFEQTLQEKKQCLKHYIECLMYVNHVAKQTDGWSEQKWPNMFNIRSYILKAKKFAEPLYQ